MMMNVYDIAVLKDIHELRDVMIKRIAQNLKKIRRQKGLTQEQVAERAGNLSVKYLGELERGLKNPTAVVLQRLSRALSEPVCVLISKDGCPFKDDGLPHRIAKLMTGKPEKDIRRAERVMEIILE